MERRDDVEMAYSGGARLDGVRLEPDKMSATFLSPMVSCEIVKHPPRPTLWILVLADPGPFSPGSKEHLLDKVPGILDIAREEEGLAHQRSLCHVEEPFVAILVFRIGQSALPPFRHFTPINTFE